MDDDRTTLPTADHFQAAISGDYVAPAAIAEILQISQTELAASLGLSQEALASSNGLGTTGAQTRLRQFVIILNRVIPWSGSPIAAFTWYRSQTLPPFGAVTPGRLVRDGRANDVLQYLDHIAIGGFA